MDLFYVGDSRMSNSGSKFGAIFLASILVFSTFTVATLMGSAPNAYAGGGEGILPDSVCNVTPIPTDNQGNPVGGLGYHDSLGVFIWSGGDDNVFAVSAEGEKNFLGEFNHKSKGVAFNSFSSL